MATLTINFNQPVPAPAGGYIVRYRRTGDVDYQQLTPNPTGSPVTIPGVQSDTAYDGTIQAICSTSNNSDVVNFSAGALVVLDKFDYLVLRYKNNNGGTDLDTFTGFVDTGTEFNIDYTNNSKWVGFSGVPGITSPYLTWAGDNRSGGGVEAVLVDFKKFIQNNPSSSSIIKIRLHAWWFSTVTSGNIKVELQTWKDGNAPVLDAANYDFIKNDGQQVDLISKDRTVECTRSGSGSPDINVKCGQIIAEIIYDTINKTANLITADGGCNCTASPL